MVVVESISKGLRVSLKREFFLPFFLLNVLVGFSFLTLLFPIVNEIHNILQLRFEEVSFFLLLNVLTLIVIYILYRLTLLWFSGTVISMLNYGGNFEKNLLRVKKVVLNLIALGILLLIINSTLRTLTSYFQTFSFLFPIFSFFIEMLLMFSAMSIVIKKDPVEISMFRSVHLVRKNLVTSLTFIVLNNFVGVCIILLGVFFSLPFFLPTFFDIMGYLKSYELTNTPDLSVLGGIVNVMKVHYFEFVLIILIFSLFLSVQNVFDVASKTTLFLKLMERRGETF